MINGTENKNKIDVAESFRRAKNLIRMPVYFCAAGLSGCLVYGAASPESDFKNGVMAGGIATLLLTTTGAVLAIKLLANIEKRCRFDMVRSIATKTDPAPR